MEKAWFEQSRSPREFFSNADAVKKRLGPERFFNQPGILWLREAWCIGKLAIELEADSCRIQQSDPPDGEIVSQGRSYAVEVTEALPPGRKRGLEYKEALQPTLIGQKTLAEHEKHFVDWLQNAIDRKSTNTFCMHKRHILLISLSCWLFFMDEAEILEKTTQIKPSSSIQKIAILHGGKIYLPFELY